MARNDRGLDMSKMAFDGFGQMMDTMEQVKRAWSTFDLPTPFTPTLSVADLDKRIADLRAIEQWLTLNQNMLRGTIQGLEIQRGTLNAVRNLSDTIGKAVQPADDAMAQSVARLAADAARDATARAPGSSAAADPLPFGPASVLSLFGPLGAFQPFGGFGRPPDPAPGPAPSPIASPMASPASNPTSTQATSPMPGAASHSPAAPLAAPTPGPAADESPAALNPLAWWELLQANFQNLATAAVGAATTPAPSSPSMTAAPTTGRTRAVDASRSRAAAGATATATADTVATAGAAAAAGPAMPDRKPARTAGPAVRKPAGQGSTGPTRKAGTAAKAATPNTAASAGTPSEPSPASKPARTAQRKGSAS